MAAANGTHVRASIRITVLATLASGVLQAVTMIVLARLLGPADYGPFAMAIALSGLSVAVVASVIERAMILERDESSLAGRGLMVVGVLVVCAGLALGVCALGDLLWGWSIDVRVAAIILFGQAAAGFAVVARARLRLQLRYGRIVAGELGGQLAGNLLLASALAMAGFGPFALALGNVAGQWVGALSVAAADASWRWQWRTDNLAALKRRTAGLLQVVSLEAVHGQIVPLALAALMGPVQLGLFNRVFNLVSLPVQLLTSAVNRVLLSVLVSVSDDEARRKPAVHKLMRAVALVITPLALGAGGANAELVALVLGPRWVSAAPLVPFLTAATWAVMIGSVLGLFAEALSYFARKAQLQAMATLVLVVCVAAGSTHGLIGVAAGTMVASLVFMLLYVRLTARLIAVPVWTVLSWLGPSLIAGGACFGVGRLAHIFLAPMWPLPVVFGAQLAGCAVASFLILFLAERTVLIEVVHAMIPAWRRRS